MRRAAPCFGRSPAPLPSLNCPPSLFWGVVGSLNSSEKMAGWRSSFAQVLVKTEAPLVLYKHLERYWAVPNTPPEDPGVRATRSNADPATGAVAAAGLPVLKTLRNLVLRKIDGVGKLSFLAINGVGEVSVLHSLFCVVESAC